MCYKTTEAEKGPTVQTGSTDFPGKTGVRSSFGYNGWGALVRDDGRNISSVDYDNLGSPAGEISPINPNLLVTTRLEYHGPVVCRNGKVERVLFSGGYATIDGGDVTFHYYTRDYQRSNRAVVNGTTGAVEQTVAYYPYGGVIADLGTGAGIQPCKFGGKELTLCNGLDEYDFGARQYYPAVPHFTRIDPLCEQDYWLSPYLYCANDPVNYTDPTGESPIYSMEGTFLGTDDKGLQGEYLIMPITQFSQSMSHSKAEEVAYKGALKDDVRQKIWDHHSTLGNRPDWDGKLTLSEANEWYRQESGDPLFVDINSLDLSNFYSLGEGFVGESKCFNLLIYGSPADGLVYGSVTFTRTPHDGVKLKKDRYDFDIKEWSRTTFIRNIETYIGKWVARKGKPYDIYFYGEKKLKSKQQWLK